MGTEKEEEKQEEERAVARKVCAKCGLTHEEELPPDAGRGDDWKLIALSAGGIGLLALIWFWVFKWGVPLVKRLSEVD